MLYDYLFLAAAFKPHVLFESEHIVRQGNGCSANSQHHPQEHKRFWMHWEYSIILIKLLNQRWHEWSPHRPGKYFENTSRTTKKKKMLLLEHVTKKPLLYHSSSNPATFQRIKSRDAKITTPKPQSPKYTNVSSDWVMGRRKPGMISSGSLRFADSRQQAHISSSFTGTVFPSVDSQSDSTSKGSVQWLRMKSLACNKLPVGAHWVWGLTWRCSAIVMIRGCHDHAQALG